MNINRFDLTPFVILALIILIVFCLFGATLANRDLFNWNNTGELPSQIDQAGRVTDMPMTTTPTPTADDLLYAQQQATMQALTVASVAGQLTLEAQQMVNTQIAYDLEMSVREREAAAAQAAADAKREQKQKDAEAFAITAMYYLIPILTVAAIIAVLLAINAMLTIRKKRAEAQRIDAHRKLQELRKEQMLSTPASPQQTPAPQRRSARPFIEQAVPSWSAGSRTRQEKREQSLVE